MGIFSGITDAISDIGKGIGKVVSGAGIGDFIDIGKGLLGFNEQQNINSANVAMSREQMEFNRQEAQKNRDFQEQQRKTQYQTAVGDMAAAGINPMLAINQGGAGTTGGSSASYGNIPQLSNRVQSALASSAMAAQIKQTGAQTELTEALAKKAEAETHQSVASTGNITQQTENLKETVNQIRQNVELQKRQSMTERQREGLVAAQAGLTSMQQRLTSGQISLTEAQKELAQITAKLGGLQVPRAANKAEAEGSWWMKNVDPYLDSAGSTINSAAKAIGVFK